MTRNSRKIHVRVREVTERIRERSRVGPRRLPGAHGRGAPARFRARGIVLHQSCARVCGLGCHRQGGAETHALAQCRHRVGLQRHAVGAPAAGALSGADQAGGARGRRHGAIRRRRARHVRRRDAGSARHGVVAVQPRCDRDGHRRRAGAQHVRLGAVSRRVRQDRARAC